MCPSAPFVEEEPLADLAFTQELHVIVGQREVEDLQSDQRALVEVSQSRSLLHLNVLPYPLRVVAFGNDGQAVLETPAEKDLAINVTLLQN